MKQNMILMQIFKLGSEIHMHFLRKDPVLAKSQIINTKTKPFFGDFQEIFNYRLI